MSLKKEVRFLIFCFLPAFFGGLPRLDAREPRLIAAVSVTGLKRTKQRTAERPLQKFIGADADRLDFDEVRAAVLDTGVLEPLAVELTEEEGSCVLRVRVREKWTVFPVPILIIGSGSMNFGAFFADTNAFGLTDIFFAGGIYGSREWMAGGGYMHSPRGGNFPGWRTAAFFSRQERHDTDQNEEDTRVFHADSVAALAAFSFSFWETGELTLGLSYGEIILKERESAFRPPPADLRTLGFETGVSVRRISWDGYLLSEKSASTGYTWHPGIGSPSFHSLRFALTWEKSVVPGLRFNFRSGGIYAPEAPVLRESSPAVARVNILPDTFSAKNYAGASAGFEKYLLRSSFGTLSLLGSWQLVFSHGSVLGDQFDHGPAGALSFYLSRLAIPAFSAGVAYNTGAGHFRGSFSLGMKF
jgi:hypothetical protein